MSVSTRWTKPRIVGSWFVIARKIGAQSSGRTTTSRSLNCGEAKLQQPLSGITSVLSERPLKSANQKTERGKILNPKYSIDRDQPASRASPLRINTLLSTVFTHWWRVYSLLTDLDYLPWRCPGRTKLMPGRCPCHKTACHCVRCLALPCSRTLGRPNRHLRR